MKKYTKPNLFLILSIFASQLGAVLSTNIRYIKIFFGIVIILFGLKFRPIYLLYLHFILAFLKMIMKHMSREY